MAPPRALYAMAITSFLLAALRLSSGAANTTLISFLCNGNGYAAGDPFAISLSYVLDDLKNSAPSYKGYDYYDISPFPNAFAYGHAACAAALVAGDCSGCLSAAVAQINSSCPMRIGARCMLVDCSVRYEQYPFVN